MRILVADPIAEDGVTRLKQAGQVDVITDLSPQKLVEQIGSYQALVVRSQTQVTAEVFAAAKLLRVVGRAGVGVDNIDLEAATQNGVLVLNAPAGNTIAAAEHAIAMMLALARNLTNADHSLHSGKWERPKFVGTELHGKTLGVFGLGKIGSEVARIASQGLQMRVLGCDSLVAPERAEQVGAELCDFETMLCEADVLTVHVPLLDSTKNIIGGEQLKLMKPTAFIINVARGGIIDETALANALQQDFIAGAAIDTFVDEPPPLDHPLLQLPQVVVTPHLGASTREASINVAADVAEQIVEFLATGTARYAVNAPALSAEELAKLAPFMLLARRLGSLCAQLCGGKVSSITCTYSGQVTDFDVNVLTAEVLGGLLAHFTTVRVNHINARTVANSHGIKVKESSISSRTNYTSTMSVKVVGETVVTAEGMQIENEPHIISLNGMRVDIQQPGQYLVASHKDEPGVIAAVSTLLAKNDINIAGIQVGRDQPRGHAVMVLQSDDTISAELREQIFKTAKLISLHGVIL